MTDPVPGGNAALTDGTAAKTPQILAPAALAQAATAAPNASAPVIAIDRPKPGETFFISPDPAMPAIPCEARIVGVQPDPTPVTRFQWTLTIDDTTARLVRCHAVEQGIDLVGGHWDPPLTDFLGGEVTIKVTATGFSGVPATAFTIHNEVKVRIRGKNPDKADIRALCLAEQEPDAFLIAAHETANTFQQFTQDGIPLLNRDSGATGLMQILDPRPTCAQRWNWQENIKAGAKLLKAHRNIARSILGRYRTNGKFPNTEGLDDVQVLRLETLMLYAGGRYWDWDKKNFQLFPNPRGNNKNFINELKNSFGLKIP
ncbi:hypothetical protein GCM10018785_34800 [Streptomyces longispororuber]|uniref:Uncharacterized protein n=1 Tax=Streptomyces longispororuber TaxID=68230 RepID=A0A918ZQ54_9ACTN|nr:hypothetical protein [Streptomyces longispororuber]GHE62896.1 hypothetical protein GCM10018785_34800 [Streptomyces longispororuber]